MTTPRKKTTRSAITPSSKEDKALAYYEQLPTPYKQMAIYNRRKAPLDDFWATIDSLSSSLVYGFDWMKSPESDEFWQKVYNASNNGGKYPEIPDFSKIKILKGIAPDYDIVLDGNAGTVTVAGNTITKEAALKLAAEIKATFEK